jgi:hypothetical protein
MEEEVRKIVTIRNKKIKNIIPTMKGAEGHEKIS